MCPVPSAEQLLVAQVRRGDADAWSQLIGIFEGRLLAFCESRIGRRAACEDLVQETFIGFLTSLPNYDGSRSLESYLFSICSYKLVDHLRREGRRPALPFSIAQQDSEGSLHLAASGRSPSAVLGSQERVHFEEEALAETLSRLVDHFKERGDWTKLKCLELLFVRGRANKEVAARLHLSEQQVANFKSDFVIQLRRALQKRSLPIDLFPELNPATS